MAAVLPASLVALVALCVLALVWRRSAARAQAAERALSRHRAALDLLPDSGFLVLDRSLRIEIAAGPGLAGFGVEMDSPVERRLRDEVGSEVWAVLEPVLRSALEGAPAKLQLPAGGRDHLVQVIPVPGRRGRADGVLLALQDVTERRRRERGLNELASKDGLTGLSNRRRLEHELARRLERVGGAVLLYVDLDAFKTVNDTLGHDAGDELLCRVARALESSVRRSDLVARMGGDEFAVLLPPVTNREARVVADKIAAAVRSVWPTGLAGGASVGIAHAGGAYSSPAAVLAAADRAMYSLKRSAKLAQAS
jgi:diguanylate cyclase (GGDEF)-like protein